MKKDKKGVWRCTKPTDLIGWTIVAVNEDTPDGQGMIELVLDRNDGKERRYVRANQDAIPVAIVQRTR